MTALPKVYSIFLAMFLLTSAVLFTGCSEGNRTSAPIQRPTLTPIPTRPIICSTPSSSASVPIVIGTPTLTKLSTSPSDYKLEVVITNCGPEVQGLSGSMALAIPKLTDPDPKYAQIGGLHGPTVILKDSQAMYQTTFQVPDPLLPASPDLLISVFIGSKTVAKWERQVTLPS